MPKDCARENHADLLTCVEGPKRYSGHPAVAFQMKSLSRRLSAPSLSTSGHVYHRIRLCHCDNLYGRSFICEQYCNLRSVVLLNALDVHAPALQPKLSRLKSNNPKDTPYHPLRHGSFATQTSRSRRSRCIISALGKTTFAARMHLSHAPP